MKVITWNVNGIRAALGKNALEWAFSQRPDLLCLQEVKARPDQLSPGQRDQLKLPFAWNAAERPGYSGVVTFFRDQPQAVELGMGERSFDVEGRIVQTIQAGFRLLNVYFPSGSTGRARVDYKLAFYARLLETCDALHRKGEFLVITGDFNTAHQPIDLRYPKENRKTSGFLPEEREWVQKFLDHGFVDAFRRIHPQQVQYTWWTSRVNARPRGIGWRLDYYLVSEGLMGRVGDVVIHDQVPGSDHCPVEMILRPA
jgi:exodeoxyribonuclease-3